MLIINTSIKDSVNTCNRRHFETLANCRYDDASRDIHQRPGPVSRDFSSLPRFETRRVIRTGYRTGRGASAYITSDIVFKERKDSAAGSFFDQTAFSGDLLSE